MSKIEQIPLRGDDQFEDDPFDSIYEEENRDDIEDEDEEENDEERMPIILKIKSYKSKFPDALSFIDEESLTDKTVKQLTADLWEVRYHVSNRNSGNLVGLAINAGIMGIETAGQAYYPQLRGLHADLNLQQAYHDTLAELSIEYQSYGYVRPEIRLGLLIGGAVVNRIQAPAPQIKTAQAKKYEDL